MSQITDRLSREPEGQLTKQLGIFFGNRLICSPDVNDIISESGSITGLSGILVSPVAGYLGDRLGRKPIFACGAIIAITSIALMVLMPYSFYNRLLLFLLLGTGAATAWTSLNTIAVSVSTELRKPVTSIYNAIKFSGYALSPAILALLYGPFHLKAVQVGSLFAIATAAFLATRAKLRGVETA